MEKSFVWKKLDCSGTPPGPRYGHAGVLVGSNLYVFGGSCGSIDENSPPDFFNDMFALDFAASPPTWRKIQQKGTIPSEREGHSLSCIGTKIFLFGGTGSDDECKNDFFVFDTTTDIWSPVQFSGKLPSKRNNHGACSIGSKIYIFGGFLDGVAGNDLYVFDAKTASWTQITPQGKVPTERCDHSFTAVGNKIVSFGGAADEVWFNDTNIFNTENNTWSPIAVKGDIPCKRDYHTAISADDKGILVFGGANDSEKIRIYSDCFVLNIATSTWLPASVSGNPPPSRWGHCAVSINQTMYIFGGTSDDKFYNDVWSLSPSDEIPQKPARTGRPVPPTPTASTSSTSTSTSTVTVTATTPTSSMPNIQSVVPNYKTQTPVPAPRRTVTPSTAGQVSKRNLVPLQNQLNDIVDSLLKEVEHQFHEIDNERAILNAEKADFAEEKKLNQELFEKQQKEIAEMIEKHRQENNELLKKRQQQYEEKIEELKKREETLKASETKFRQTLLEFEENKKKMEAIMAQFSAFKT